jgi:hypothetical protein
MKNLLMQLFVRVSEPIVTLIAKSDTPSRKVPQNTSTKKAMSLYEIRPSCMRKLRSVMQGIRTPVTQADIQQNFLIGGNPTHRSCHQGQFVGARQLP